MSDPKLKTAAAEIEAICKKHDIAATVCLQTPKATEFLMVLDPSWSVMYVMDTPEGPAIRFRSKKEDFASKEEQHRKTEDSVSILLGFHSQAERFAQALSHMIAALAKHMDIDHWERRE